MTSDSNSPWIVIIQDEIALYFSPFGLFSYDWCQPKSNPPATNPDEPESKIFNPYKIVKTSQINFFAQKAKK